ncbi:MAG: PucR family transcriptional regulator [Actinomadura sp.]
MAAAGPAANAAESGLRESAAPGPGKVDSRDEALFLRKIVAMCGRLSALASQDVDLAGVVRFLSDGVGAEVALLDRTLEVLACAGVADPADVLGKLPDHTGGSGPYTVLAAVARNRRPLTVPVASGDGSSMIVAPVSVGQDVAGYLLAVSGRDHDLAEDMRLLVTEHAAMVCGVLLGRDLVVAAAAGRARQELFEGLLQTRDREDGEADRWARHLGFDPKRRYHVLAVALARSESGTALSSVESLLARLTPDAIVAGRPDEVVAIVPVKGSVEDEPVIGLAEIRTLAGRCVDLVAERRLGVAAIGVGNACHTATDIARSYAEASRALAATVRMGESGGVTVFADLGIHRLLLRVPDVGDLRAFAEEVIGRLLEEEAATGVEYLTTLSVYFNENSSPRRTAQRLHVHPNTVSYRIRRVEEITGLSFDVHRDRLMAEVAVEILAGLGSL